MLNVATNGPTGHPHVVAMWYTVLDGRPAFWTFARSQKIQNLRRDDRITGLVEAGDEYTELRGVELSGGAGSIEDPAEVLAPRHRRGHALRRRRRLGEAGAAFIGRRPPSASAW